MKVRCKKTITREQKSRVIYEGLKHMTSPYLKMSDANLRNIKQKTL